MVVVMRPLFLFLVALLLSSCYSTRVADIAVSSHSRQKAIAHSKPGVYGKVVRPVVYTVHPNDTLYSIGKRFGVDYRVIARRNRLHSPFRIYVGQHLYITRTAPRSQVLPIARRIYQAPVKTAKRRHLTKINNSARTSKASYKTKALGYTKGSLLWPVKGKVTSRFGRRRGRMHDGIDISAKEGTPIHAAAAGTVVYADHRLSGYGNLVIIRHGRNLFTAYAHNQRNLARKGIKVRRGDVIARVGHTGRSSGAHLHFEVRHGSTAVDPLAYLPGR
jgi:lipoprotein NlpD